MRMSDTVSVILFAELKTPAKLLLIELTVQNNAARNSKPNFCYFTEVVPRGKQKN